jgi:hypothetical protein
VRLKNHSPTPKDLFGAKSKARYPMRKDGDVFKAWKSDVLETPDLFDIL